MPESSSEGRSATSPADPDPAAPPRTSWPFRIGTLLAIVLIAAAIFWLHARNTGGHGGPGSAAPAPAPVRTIHPELRDVPIHLEGLGIVTPLETAVVRARVSGQLQRILFVEGQTVHAGDALAEIDPRPFRVALAQGQALLARDAASLAAARALLARDRQLHDHELLSTQDLEAQQAVVASLEATQLADHATADAARLNLEYTHVVAPIDGRTGLRQIDAGNLVSSSDANGIVVITRVDPISVLFTLPQDDLGSVLDRMAEQPLVVEVLSRDGARMLATGHLSVVDNRIDATTGTIRMKAEVPNATQALWPNQLALTRMLLETRRGVMVVPDAAVQQGPDGAFVYVVVDHHAQVRPVHVDRIVGDVAILRDGLALTDEVVSEGQSRLRPNAEVRLETDPIPDAGPRGAR